MYHRRGSSSRRRSELLGSYVEGVVALAQLRVRGREWLLSGPIEVPVVR